MAKGTKPQIPYFIQNIEISEVEFEDEENLLKYNILMPPLNVEVVFTSIFIDKV